MFKKIISIGIYGILGISMTQAQRPKKMAEPFHFSYSFRKDTFDIRKFGAVGDGFTLNTTAINKAIENCSKKGGGVVLVPPGMWLTGPVVLKSNVNLHLEASATLLATSDFSQYKLQASNWEGSAQMRNQSPVSADNAVNIAITGKGIIDGNGDAWRMVKKDKLSNAQWKRLLERGGILSDDQKTWYPSEKSLKGAKISNPGLITPEKTPAFYDSVKDFLRPNMILLSSCKNILLEGITFQNSPAWCIHPLMAENISVKNITVKNPWYAQNGDGIDLESCNHVSIENSVFDVGDDALCMKSGRDEQGRKRNKPTENVYISGCTVYASHGGFVIGSEMSGGVRNVSVDNCTFIGTDIGLRFKSTRGRGGLVENIDISNIYMKNIVGEAILFDMYYSAKDPIPVVGEKRELPKIEVKPFDVTTPVFRNFKIRNIFCDGAAKAVFVRGLPEAHIENIQLNNLHIRSKEGIEIQEASAIVLKNVTIDCANANPLINIANGDHLEFDNFITEQTTPLLFYASGEKSTDIVVKNTSFNHVVEKYKIDTQTIADPSIFKIK